MKAQCERCKEIVALEFTVGEGGIQVRCGSCEASYFVSQSSAMPVAASASVIDLAAAAAAAPPQRAASRGFRCPKCDEPQPEGASCRRCGLVYEKWKGHEPVAADSLPSVAEARAAGELFAACEEHWTEPERHDRFLAFCQQTNALGYAAARYRARIAARRDSPKDSNDAIAVERLEQIRTLAEATLTRNAPAVGVGVAATGSSAAYGRLKLVALGIVVLLAIGTLWVAFFRPPAPVDEGKPGTAPTAPKIPSTRVPPGPSTRPPAKPPAKQPAAPATTPTPPPGP